MWKNPSISEETINKTKKWAQKENLEFDYNIGACLNYLIKMTNLIVFIVECNFSYRYRWNETSN